MPAELFQHVIASEWNERGNLLPTSSLLHTNCHCGHRMSGARQSLGSRKARSLCCTAAKQQLFERGTAELACAQTAAALIPFSQAVWAPYRNATLTFTGSLSG